MKYPTPAVKKIQKEALELMVKCEVIANPKPHYRRYSSLGSTSVPSKVVILNDKRFSLGGARQYLGGKNRLVERDLKLA